MVEVLQRLKGVRSISAKALRPRIEAALIKSAKWVCGIAFLLLLCVIGVAKGQQYGALPAEHRLIDGLVWLTLVCLGLALAVLLALLVVALWFVQKNAYEALIIEAQHDQAIAEARLREFNEADLLAAKVFLQSKVADFQERITSFYGGGAVFLLALATAAWAISKDLLGEQRLRELTTVHIANAAPAIIAFVVGMAVIIAAFRPIKSIFGYHLRLIEVALALQSRETKLAKIPIRPCRRCRFLRGIFGCSCALGA